MARPSYSYFISWSEKDREYVATFLELSGLSGLATTIPDAIRELDDALSAWIATAEEDNFELPPASFSIPAVVLDTKALKFEDIAKSESSGGQAESDTKNVKPTMQGEEIQL